LMPLQRLLTIYLAAVGLHVLCRLAAVAAGRWRVRVTDGLQLTAVALVLVVYLGPLGLMPADAAGLYPTDRSSTPETAALQLQLAIAQREAGPGDAILVVGSLVSAHQQLSAPLVAERPYFYDNWMWSWHTQHVGPYDPRHTAWYAPKRIATIFTREYLATHGIGAVVVATDRAQRAAAASAALEQLTAGAYAVYTVIDRTPIVTFGTAPADRAAIANHAITAAGRHDGGSIVIRRNWHPRWHADVNGHPVSIAHRPDGYMSVEAPAGDVNLTLRYVLDRWDWAGRAAAAAGLLLVAWTLLRRRLGSLVTVRRSAG